MLIGAYNGGLVILSILVAATASYVALDMAGRVTAASGRARAFWLAGGATAMGTGIWSMHYIAMLAFRLPVPVFYDVPTVVVSLVAATIASGIALFVVSRRRLSAASSVVGALAMGGAVAAMHYIGMEAMRLAGMCHWNYGIVTLSVVIAVVVSYVALWLAFHFRSETRALAPLKVAAASVMGLAVAGMHYTGMAAVTFIPSDVIPDTTYAVSVSSLGVAGIAVVTFMVLALAVLSSLVDRRLTAQAEAVRASEERYRLLFNRSLAGVYQGTLDGQVIDGNDALARLLGYASREACLGAGARALQGSSDMREPFLTRLMAEKTVANFEHRLTRADGRHVWVLESATLVEGAAGRAPVIEGTIVDITRRKEAEDQIAPMTAALVSSVERYRLLIESTHAVPWEMDGETMTVLYLSPQATRMFGYDVDALVGNAAVWDLIHSDDRARVRAQFDELVMSRNADGLDTSYRIMTGSGRVAYVRSVVGAHAGEASGHAILRGITLDVTEQRRLEAELQQAQKLESVGRLAAGVAHEINTPVQFVGDSLSFVRDGIDELGKLIAAYRAVLAAQDPDALATARERATLAEQDADLEYLLTHLPSAVDRALEGLERVATIVRSMKEFAHPDQKDMAAVDLNRAVQSTLTVAQNEYKYVADVDVDLGDIPPVICHGGDVNQAVLNIIVNAAHAIGGRVRGSETKGRIEVATRREGNDVVITIGDTGGGIPEAIQGRIFDPFFTTKEVGKGTGQGLSIARSVIVEKHGGNLTFESVPGVGTTFLIRLPIAGQQPAGVAA